MGRTVRNIGDMRRRTVSSSAGSGRAYVRGPWSASGAYCSYNGQVVRARKCIQGPRGVMDRAGLLLGRVETPVGRRVAAHALIGWICRRIRIMKAEIALCDEVRLAAFFACFLLMEARVGTE